MAPRFGKNLGISALFITSALAIAVPASAEDSPAPAPILESAANDSAARAPAAEPAKIFILNRATTDSTEPAK